MRRHREDIFYTTCTACKDFDRRDSSTAPAAALGMTITSVTLSGAIAESKGLEFAEHAPVRFVRIYANPPSRPLGCARGDSLCCHVERSDSETETSRLDGTFTLTNHTRNAHNAETNINDRSRCSIIPRLERGTPAVDGFVTYHSTFSSLDGGAFHPLRAIFHTNGRHALILSAIPGGHAVFETSSTLYIGTSAEEELCARIECLASAGRSPFITHLGRHARSGHAVLTARFHDGRPLNGLHSISFLVVQHSSFDPFMSSGFFSQQALPTTSRRGFAV